MVFSGDRSSEQSHDPVTANLVHKTIVLMGHVHQNLQDGSKYFECLFRIEFVDECGRPADVNEKNCDMFAVAGHRAAGMQYPLDQLGRDL